jgi:hypothetical protein
VHSELLLLKGHLKDYKHSRGLEKVVNNKTLIFSGHILQEGIKGLKGILNSH